MRVWDGLESVRTPFPAATLAIGTFDGMHRGHQALIGAAVEDAKKENRESVVFTFNRHPSELVSPDRVPGYLTTPRQKLAPLESLNVDNLVVANFDERFRSLSPEAFLRFVVKGVLGAERVFVGFDFRFGHDQAGDPKYLNDARTRLDFETIVLNPIMVKGNRASSSRVRDLLRAGELAEALEVLGHPYTLSGKVVQGQQLGRSLGFPTANIAVTRRHVIPADGIYAVWAEVNGDRYKGACSIGVRPTIGGRERAIEVYLLGFSGDLYGKTMDVEFVERLRDEARFDSLEILASQIAMDVRRVAEILR